MKKHTEKSEPAYTLHIDAVPHVAKKHVEKPVEHKEKSHSRVWAFIWDKVQFIFVSIVVFVVVYVFINWQALQMNVEHYWNVYRGVKSPLENLVAEKQVEPEKLFVPGEVSKSETRIPQLNLEIYPPDMRIIIPRINQNVPVVSVRNDNLIDRKWENLEADIQKALQNGVIHYPGTALPGDNGNVVITGHSSYYAWDAGRFKDVFSLLHDTRIKDRVVIFFNQRKFIYEIIEKKVVFPKDVDVLLPSKSEQLTLITCTPIGTNLKRLVVTAKLVEKS